MFLLVVVVDRCSTAACFGIPIGFLPPSLSLPSFFIFYDVIVALDNASAFYQKE
jgi:hypothetical protein